MKSKYISSLFYFKYLLFLLGLYACDLKDAKEVNPTLSFTKIYDNDQFTKSYIPLDVKQTNDGGYLILAETKIETSSFPGIFILKTDSAGNHQSNQLLPNNSVNPISELIPTTDGFYFFCMSVAGNEAKLMKVGMAGDLKGETIFSGVSNPLSVSQESPNNFVIQYYNQDEFAIYVARISAGIATPTSTQSFPLSKDGYNEFKIEKAIYDQMGRIGRKKPFLSGAVGGGIYYFNGYLEETLSLVFFDFATEYVYGPDGGEEPAKLLGVNDSESISSLLQIGANKFASSRYVNGDNFFTPFPKTDFNFSTNAVIPSSEFTRNPIPELFPDAKVVLKRIQVNGKNILLYASDTKSKQIVLFAYDESNGALLGKKYLGSGFPYEIGSFVQTQDKGLVVVGTTYLTGRFPRICLFKLTENDLIDLVNLTGGK